MALLITFLLGAFFLLGAVIIKIFGDSEALEHYSIAAALGALAAISATDLIPDIIGDYSGAGYITAILLTAAGVAVLMLLDHFVPDHENEHNSENPENMVHIGVMSMIAISIHNIVEGMTVYSIASQSIGAGVSLSVGVGLHNIPMGMLIFSTLRASSRKKKYIVLGTAALSTFVGGVLMQLISEGLSDTVISGLVCLAFGMVIYIVVFELLPSVLHDKKWGRTLIGVLIGAAFVLASFFFE